MSVLVEAISVIVRVETLNAKYPGGARAYFLDCPNPTFCSDGILTRVGFMAACDVKVWVERLQGHGFTALDENDCFVDLAVIDQVDGPTRECHWLEWGTHRDGFALTWLEGTDPSRFRAPRNWKLEDSLSRTFKRTLEEDQEAWLSGSHQTHDGMLQRRNPVTGKTDHLAVIWGPVLPDRVN